MMQLTAHDFEIEVVSQESKRLTYRVTGQVTCPTPGFTFVVSGDNEGINPTDEYAVLKIEAASPTHPQAEVITEVPVRSEDFSDSAQLKHVDLRLYGDIGSAEGDVLHLTL